MIAPQRPSSRSVKAMTDVTRILSAVEQGDPHAAAQLLPLVYDELRNLAAARLAREKPGHTLDIAGRPDRVVRFRFAVERKGHMAVHEADLLVQRHRVQYQRSTGFGRQSRIKPWSWCLRSKIFRADLCGRQKCSHDQGCFG